MSGLLVFVAGDEPVTLARRNETGVTDLCGPSPLTMRAESAAAGVDGKTGWLFADEKRLGEMVFRIDPKRQTWQRFGDVYLGFYTDARPTPTDLQRPTMLPGVPVTLADGNDWTVPLARVFTDDAVSRSILPRSLVLQGDAWTAGDVIARYVELETIVSGFWDAWQAAFHDAVENDRDTFRIEYADPVDAAVKVLAYNYTLDRRVASVLGLFDSVNGGGPVLEATCDTLSVILYAAKKKQAKLSD